MARRLACVGRWGTTSRGLVGSPATTRWTWDLTATSSLKRWSRPSTRLRSSGIAMRAGSWRLSSNSNSWGPARPAALRGAYEFERCAIGTFWRSAIPTKVQLSGCDSLVFSPAWRRCGPYRATPPVGETRPSWAREVVRSNGSPAPSQRALEPQRLDRPSLAVSRLSAGAERAVRMVRANCQVESHVADEPSSRRAQRGVGDRLRVGVAPPPHEPPLRYRRTRGCTDTPPAPGSGSAAAASYAQVAHRRARLASKRACRAAARLRASSSGTAAPVPKYISSGVWPWNAECGMVELCCTT